MTNQTKKLPNISSNSEKFQFFRALQSLKSDAILLLSHRLQNVIKSLNGIYLLSKEDIEELVNDAILVTLKKIGNGQYQFQDYDPLTYTTIVFKNLLNNRLRKKVPKTVELTVEQNLDLSPEDYYIRKEKEQQLSDLLKTLDKNCEEIIRLKYYEQLKDETIVNKKLSPYSTIDSLKSKRSQCLKKLAGLVRDKGIIFKI